MKRFLLPVLLASAIAGCGTFPRLQAERILEDGDCATVPDIERLAMTVSDHGTKVVFRWSATRFAGTVLTDSGPFPKDASSGPNQPGEWEKRFAEVSAANAIPGSFLGFPAASNARAGVLAAAIYEEQYPATGTYARAVAIVDVKAQRAQILGTQRRVQSVAWSPKGDYAAVLETAPTTKLPGWREMFGLSSPQSAPQSDVHATIYHAGGLVGCSRRLASGLPSPNTSVAWE
jgi:hypothetical protein